MHLAEKKRVIVHTSADGGTVTSFKRWLTTTPWLKQFINQIVKWISLAFQMLTLVFTSLHPEVPNCLYFFNNWIIIEDQFSQIMNWRSSHIGKRNEKRFGQKNVQNVFWISIWLDLQFIICENWSSIIIQLLKNTGS